MDTLANAFSTLQNAYRVGHPCVRMPFSSHTWGVLFVLYTEGYLEGFVRRGAHLVVKLKYTGATPCIRSLRRVSRPGKRRYVRASGLRLHRQGLGMHILSTPYGVLCDRDAARLGVGGEVVARVL